MDKHTFNSVNSSRDQYRYLLMDNSVPNVCLLHCMHYCTRICEVLYTFHCTPTPLVGCTWSLCHYHYTFISTGLCCALPFPPTHSLPCMDSLWTRLFCSHCKEAQPYLHRPPSYQGNVTEPLKQVTTAFCSLKLLEFDEQKTFIIISLCFSLQTRTVITSGFSYTDYRETMHCVLPSSSLV